jgi:hypothetical protein
MFPFLELMVINDNYSGYANRISDNLAWIRRGAKDKPVLLVARHPEQSGMLPALLLAIRLITSSCILRAMRITWK